MYIQVCNHRHSLADLSGRGGVLKFVDTWGVSGLWPECGFQITHVHEEWQSGMIVVTSGIEFKQMRGLLKSAKGSIFERCDIPVDF